LALRGRVGSGAFVVTPGAALAVWMWYVRVQRSEMGAFMAAAHARFFDEILSVREVRALVYVT
jgi:hypothetical protein